ncbi:PIG-L deacetylase family protein [Actinokineospora sp.]|uniref:PIG-L deacetylase family protein n=1 Tax=Actinokineospora sp. TaxID=1872133 RepID=UPI004038049E
MSTVTPRGDVRRALVVCAHPDDVDFGAAGTVASWTAAGIDVAYCVCTSGEAGDAAPETRRAEQIAAAAVVGVHEVTFLDHPDGALTASLELRRDITRVIRRFRPDRVLTWTPEINWDMVVTAHPDHRATGAAAFAAVYPDSRNPHAHRELLRDQGLPAWTVRELWLVDAPGRLRNHAVDITDTFDKKLAALHAHQSQIDSDTSIDVRLRRHFGEVAARYDLPEGRLAEDFQVVDTG